MDLVVKSQTTFATIYRHFMLRVSSVWLHWTGLRQRLVLEQRDILITMTVCGGFVNISYHIVVLTSSIRDTPEAVLKTSYLMINYSLKLLTTNDELMTIPWPQYRI